MNTVVVTETRQGRFQQEIRVRAQCLTNKGRRGPGGCSTSGGASPVAISFPGWSAGKRSLDATRGAARAGPKTLLHGLACRALHATQTSSVILGP
jgi:hypothetical protein